MRTVHNLRQLSWTLTGWIPYEWRARRSTETAESFIPPVAPLPAAVPGSVQGALGAAGIIPAMTVGLNARACEWIENRLSWLVY